MPDHLLYISSWYPRVGKSEGTFIEMQLRALAEVGVKAAILLTDELTAGNYLRKRMRKNKLTQFRIHPEIAHVDNLVVHRMPLRWAADAVHTRREAIIRHAVRKVEEYIGAHGRPVAIFHHGIFDYCYLTAALSKHFDLPYWYMEHSAFVTEGAVKSRNAFESGSDLRTFVKSASRRFAVSNSWAQRYASLFGVSFSVVPNVLSSDFFTEQPAHKPASPFRFVNIGLLEEHKQQELLLRAFAKSFSSRPEVRLTIAGDGRLGNHLKACAQELGIAPQVDFPGYLDRAGVKAELDRSHAFVLSSSHETFGVVLIEAMARGLPVIAPEMDGPRELVFGGVGTLFRPGDVAHLAEQMRWMNEVYRDYDPSHISAVCRQRFGAASFKSALFDSR